MDDSLLNQLKQELNGNFRNDEETLNSFSTDHSHIWIKPQGVAAPADVAELKSLVRFVNNRREIDFDLSLTVRAGGACVTGGPLNDSLIVDITAGLNKILNLSPSEVRVQPGMSYSEFDRETKKLGSYLPPYPASRDICCIGGMIANNSGGPQSFRYGKVNKFVKSQKVIFADGEEYNVEPLDQSTLQKKMDQDDFEGSIYRDLFGLITDNYEAIQKAKPRASKNSAGYPLWNVWDPKKKIFDLNQIIVGSQGTLGIVTETTFKLQRFLPVKKLMVIFLKDAERLTELIGLLSDQEPEELEMYHQSVMRMIGKHFPTFAETLNVNPLTFGFEFSGELWEILKTKPMIPDYVILPKFSGESEAEVDRAIEKAQLAIRHLDLPVFVTEDRKDMEKYKKLRHDSFYFFQNSLGGKDEVIFFDDICIPTEHLSECLPKFINIVERCNCEYFMAGHIGNGNIHLVPFMDANRPEDQNIIKEMIHEAYDIVLGVGGTISGEHNDGLTRTPFLKKMYGSEIYELFVRTKKIFDPKNIFNPGKKVMNSHSQNLQYAFDHMMKPKD